MIHNFKLPIPSISLFYSSVSYVKKRLPDVYIHSLRIGNSQTEDAFNGFFMDATDQINMACDMIRNDPMLKNG